MTSSRPNTRCRMRPPRNRRRGFTFVEIVLVIVILTIMGLVAVPMGLDSTDTQAVAAASRITGDLEYAQSVAISTGTSVTVTFSPSNDTYSLSNPSGLLQHPMNRTNYLIAFPSMREMSQADITAADFGGASTVTFDEMGAPGSGGTVVVQAGATVITVSVAEVTGLVKVGVVGEGGGFGCQ